MTLVARAIPPSPPNSADGHSLPQDSFEHPGPYAPGYNLIRMASEESNCGNQPQAMHYGSPPYYAPTSYSQNMPPQSMMMGPPQVTTPPAGYDESLVSMGSPAMMSPSPPSSRSPRSRGKGLSKAMASKQRRNHNRKDTDGFKIDSAISKLTASFHNTPIKDMDAWVARSPQERRDEVRKKNGKISRPMNSFMLYRSAYAERTKRLVGANNHQIVSKVAGMGWKHEPEEIRQKYENLAKIERDNHAATHPEYKFSPKKDGSINSRRDGSSPSSLPAHLLDDGVLSDMESDYGSTMSSMGRPRSFSHSRTHSFEDSFYNGSRDSSPFNGHDPLMAPGYVHGRWQNPSHPTGLHGMQPHQLQGPSFDDVRFRAPSPNNQEVSYGSSLSGIPGAAHHELLQPQLAHGIPMVDMDPRLLSNSNEFAGVMNMGHSSYTSTPGSYSSWADEGHNGYFATSSAPPMLANNVAYAHASMTSAYLPSMQNEARDTQWDMNRPADPMADATPAEFEMWVETGHPSNNNNY
ncbi:High mobility group superfamily [Penicillium sp. DV-2018c]|nr:High mobility group superfamily [Penicillium sp. DV-2018c]KAJ5567388.1 High mobility group superfamily [Penicillium sp. DV-2018c]